MMLAETGWWVADLLAVAPDRLVAVIVWVVFSICMHELAHGWAAIRLGDRTPIELGHMNLNPFTHIGHLGLIVFALVGITWGAMPVDPSRLRGRYAEAFVAVAGPAMNGALAVLCVLIGGLVVGLAPSESHVQRLAWTVFTVGVGVNIALGLFNLLPVPPLDGARILSDFSSRAREFYAHPRAPFVGLFVLIAVFWLLPGGVFGFVTRVGEAAVLGVANLLGAGLELVPAA